MLMIFTDSDPKVGHFMLIFAAWLTKENNGIELDRDDSILIAAADVHLRYHFARGTAGSVPAAALGSVPALEIAVIGRKRLDARSLAITRKARLSETMRCGTLPTLESAMKTRWAMIGAAVLMLTACAVDPGPGRVDTSDPYYYSTSNCAGCWYGEWGGRTGYHRGGGRPWEREHSEADRRGQGYWRPATVQDLNDPNVKQNESGQIWQPGRPQ